MKKIFTLIAMLSFIFATAQYEYGTLYLKDGTTQKGFVKKREYQGIKFKAKKDEKPITYDYKLVMGFENSSGKYRYKFIVNNSSSPKLMKLVIKGKITLYEVSFKAGGGYSAGPEVNVTHYYISNNENDKVNFLGHKLKKKHYKFFKDCPGLIEKINSKKIKRKNIKEVINYYNKNCK